MRSAGRPIRWSMIVGTLLGGVAIGATGHQLLAAPPPFTETPLYRGDLTRIDKHELIVWSHGRPYHAGHEVVYVLEGEGTAAAFKFLLVRIHAKGEPLSVELNRAA